MADDDKLSTLSLMDDGDEDDSLMGTDDEIDGILDMNASGRVDSSSNSDNDTFDVNIAPVSIDLQPVQANDHSDDSVHDAGQDGFSSLDDFLEDEPSPVPGADPITSTAPIAVNVQAPARAPVVQLEPALEPEAHVGTTQRKLSDDRGVTAQPEQVNVTQSRAPVQAPAYDVPNVIPLQVNDYQVEQNAVPVEQPPARQEVSVVSDADRAIGVASKVEITPVENIPSVVLGSASGGEVDVGSIRKIIAIIDNYRSLDETSKETTKSFISTLAQVRNISIDVSNEAALVKGIIEVDPQMRDAVHNLIDAKSKVGSERVFFLLDLDAESLKNINLLLMITDISKQKLSIEDDDIQSLKEGARELTGLLDQLKDNQVSYIKKLDKVLQSSAKILESEDSDDERK